jgi:hypothetical protein
MDLYRPGSIKQPDFQVLRGAWRLTVKLCHEMKVERVKSVIAEGVKEIWLSSEDTGAYGTNLRPPCWNLLKLLDVLHFFHFIFPNLLCLFQFLLFFYISGHTMSKVLIEASLVFHAGIDLGTDLPTLLNA